mmetsp:Transcript_161/g.413  ORF Transcript_161/g.413 Transcript_161/m.413 type:complete len:498 (-) Transcript_161:238-1731(-)
MGGGSNGAGPVRLFGPLPWDPIVEALPPMPWEGAITELSQTTGFAADQLRYTLCLLLAIPTGFLFKALTTDPHGLKPADKAAAIATRHTVCFAFGTCFMLFAFGYDIWHAFFSCSVGFLLMKYVPAKHVHIVVTCWAMGYMSCSHIYRMIVAYASWEVDFTTPQLLITQKLMNIAFALHDSSRPPSTLSEEQGKRVIPKPLTLSEFFGYMFCMHTLLAGPSCDYNDYITWIDGSKLHGRKDSPLVAVLLRIAAAVYCVVMFIGVGAYFPVSVLGDREWLYAQPMWWVLFFDQAALALARHRYYFAWTLSDAACVAAGLGFNGLDDSGKARWDGVLNIKYLDVEMATNFRSAMTGWNIAVSNWLRRCVYERVPSAYRTTASFTMSALWHGFYPGYYMTFCSAALWNETARLMRRHIRPYVIPDAKAEKSVKAYAYHVGSTFITIISLNYLGTPFQVQSLYLSTALWGYWLYLPHAITIGLYFAVPVLFPMKREAKKTQ